MANKKKSKKIVMPAIVLVVALSLVIVFSNFTQVKGFVDGIVNYSSDLSAAATKVPKTSVKILSVTNQRDGTTIFHSGDPIQVSWITNNIASSSNEKIDVRIQTDGALQTVGKGFKEGLSFLGPIGDIVIGGANTVSGVVPKKAPDLSDREMSVKQGPGGHAWLLGSLSQTPGKVSTKITGEISKKVNVVATLYHLKIDPENDQNTKNVVDASDKVSEIPIIYTLEMGLPKIEDSRSADVTVVHPGDRLKIVWKETGAYGWNDESGVFHSDFAPEIDISVGSLSAKSFPFTFKGKRNGFDTDWTVPDFVTFPGKIDTSVAGKVRKSVVIKGSLPYIGDGAAAEKAPKLVAVSPVFQVEDNASTLDLKADKTSVPSGSPVTLTWSSTDSVFCEAPWISSKLKEDDTLKGTAVVNPTKNTTYTLTCVGDDTIKRTAKVMVTVVAATTVPVATLIDNERSSGLRNCTPAYWYTLRSDGSVDTKKDLAESGLSSNCLAPAFKNNQSYSIMSIYNGYSVTFKYANGSSVSYSPGGDFSKPVAKGWTSVVVKEI